MKNLLEFLLIHLCNHPEDVRIEEDVHERETIYTLHVHPEDMGRVIGKSGSIINSIRAITKVRAVKEGIRATIVLAEHAEPDERAQSTEPAPEAAPETTPEVAA